LLHDGHGRSEPIRDYHADDTSPSTSQTDVAVQVGAVGVSPVSTHPEAAVDEEEDGLWTARERARG
jgi:hypothetical protein